MSNQKVTGVRLTTKGLQLVSSPKIELHGGERLGTMLQRKRDKLEMSVADLVDGLPIRANVYERIEAGINPRPPDDILEAIGKKLRIKSEKLKKVADLDADDPVERFFF